MVRDFLLTFNQSEKCNVNKTRNGGEQRPSIPLFVFHSLLWKLHTTCTDFLDKPINHHTSPDFLFCRAEGILKKRRGEHIAEKKKEEKRSEVKWSEVKSTYGPVQRGIAHDPGSVSHISAHFIQPRDAPHYAPLHTHRKKDTVTITHSHIHTQIEVAFKYFYSDIYPHVHG